MSEVGTGFSLNLEEKKKVPNYGVSKNDLFYKCHILNGYPI
jgi:hypothetical protein